jgi:adenylate kinase
MDTPTFIFINGKPSSGKDTQANFLQCGFGETSVVLSTGEICREAQKESSPYYKYLPLIEPYIYHVEKEGGFYPDEVIIAIVRDIIENKMAEGLDTFVFTGFPRTEGQLEAVDGMLKIFSNAESYHLNFQIPDDTARDRARYRRKKAEETGGDVRHDDEEAVVERRLNSFQTLTLPMLDRLDREGRLTTISATGSIPEVERETASHFSKERL